MATQSPLVRSIIAAAFSGERDPKTVKLRSGNEPNDLRLEKKSMVQTIKVPLTLEHLETIADALEYTGSVIEEEIKEYEPGTEEHEGLSADLEDVTKTMEIIADAMEELVGDEEG